MNYLLDSHAFLWFVLDDASLSTRAREAMEDERSEVFVSPATFWELAIKISIGKYQIPRPFVEFMHDQLELNDFTILPVSIEHAGALSQLPFHHRDPFDRMIISQSIIEQYPVISVDAVFDQYGIQRVW